MAPSFRKTPGKTSGTLKENYRKVREPLEKRFRKTSGTFQESVREAFLKPSSKGAPLSCPPSGARPNIWAPG